MKPWYCYAERSGGERLYLTDVAAPESKHPLADWRDDPDRAMTSNSLVLLDGLLRQRLADVEYTDIVKIVFAICGT